MISVIVPIYKAEKYLHRCIDSILTQSYTDFELLLIDDGSPDNSGAICEEYALRDSRVRVFHKENGGVSSARNLGLDKAQGEWISFVDSDDWIDNNHLECLIIGGITDNDFIFGGIKLCASSKSIKFVEKKYEYKSLIDFINCNKGYRLNSPCGHLYKRTILKNNGIRFDVGIRFGEDAIFNLRYLCFCNSVRTISSCGYNYWDYDISNDAPSKYKLSIDEVYYTLNKMLSLNKLLGQKNGGNVSSEADYAMMLGMISLENRCDIYKGKDFYTMCYNWGLVKNYEDFYNNELCSPIYQGIAQLKYYYEIGDYIKGKDVYELLNSLSGKVATVPIKDIRFRNKDFYVWYVLIKRSCFALLDLFLRSYFSLKKILQK